VGTAFLTTGIITGIITLQRASSLKERCPDCHQSEIDANKPRAHLATASFVIAALGFGGGAAALVLHGKGQAKSEAAMVRPAIGVGSVGVEGRF
jgi:hypothetical protein